MAAAHANRSPSPIAPSSRPINPSLKNSESNSVVRRSFSAKPSVLTNPRRFDPTTPANSPSDFGRRHSVDSYPKEKENYEKDHSAKPSKFQPSAKPSKNFMSPTISAACKFSPSPKKKVLAERNDPVRTTISLSDGKAIFLSSQSPNASVDLGYEKGQRIMCSLDLNNDDLEKKQAVQEGGTQVSKSLKKVSFLDVPSDSGTESLSESVITESDSSNMESSLKNELSCLWDSSSIAQLDADPSLLPYDPKNNYLSPRPQFLHYKPNPRVEILLNKEKGLEADELKQLEDNLLAEILSESFSDSEEILSEVPLKEEMGILVSDDLVVGVEEGIQDSPLSSVPSDSSLPFGTAVPNADSVDNAVKEMGILVSDDLVVGVEEGTEDSPLSSVPSDPSLPIGTAVPNADSVENAVKEREKKPRLFSSLACFPMILMLLIACGSVFVFHSPAFEEIALTEMRYSDVSKLYDQSRLIASAKMNFDLVARHVNQFSADSMSYISNLVNAFGKGEDMGSLQFMNVSSSLQYDGWNQERFLNEEVGKEIVEDLEEDRWNQGGFLNEVVHKVVEDLEEDDEFNTQETEEVLEGSDEDELEEVNAEMGIFEEEEAYPEVDYSDDNLEEEEFDTGEDFVEAETVSPDCVNPAELESEDPESTADAEMDRLGVTSHPQGSELLEAAAAASETAETEESHDGNDIGSPPPSMNKKIPSDANSLTKAIQSSLPTESAPYENKFHMYYVTGLSALVISLFAGAAAYAYPRMPNIVRRENRVKQCEHTGREDRKMYPQHWQQTESSFSSETSSFKKTAASYSAKEMRDMVSEVQSTERRKMRKHYSKREPLSAAPAAVSSSEYTTDSASSYGSFTTFERIPIKNNANRDEEVITPVRRSSRIRSHHQIQVTSP